MDESASENTEVKPSALELAWAEFRKGVAIPEVTDWDDAMKARDISKPETESSEENAPANPHSEIRTPQ